MPKKPETLFQEKVIRDLKMLPRTYFFKKQASSIRGIPDIILCVAGQFVALELKVGDNQADPLQAYNIHKIREAKGVAAVVTPETWPTWFHNMMLLAKEYAR